MPPPPTEQGLLTDQSTVQEPSAELSVAATESHDAPVAPISKDDGAVTDEAHGAVSDVDPRLLALAQAAIEAVIELPEHVVAEPTPAMDAEEEVADEPSAASSDETLWASPDDVDVASLAPSIDQPTPVEDSSDPWTVDVPAETAFSTVDEPAPGIFVDTPTSLHAAPSNAPLDDVIDASSIEPPAQLDPSPTIPIPDPPAVEPRGTVRELQVVLSPIGSFPELLRLQARIGSLSSVHALRLRDFRGGIATFSVGVTEGLTGREFGAVLQMFTELRLRLEGAGENTVELRVDPEVAP
jgi:hypothetical protein